MAHYDCWNCGGSLYDYPNCCQETQDDYIEIKKIEWARNKATQLSEEHIDRLMKKLLDDEAYRNDECFIDINLKEIKPIRGAKLR
jgi:hypothetical protein